MVFKRQINGKEYMYTSERIDGQVKSVYLGPAKKKSRIIRPFFVSLLIISLLILSSPVQAVTVRTSTDKSLYKADDLVNITVSVDLDPFEKIPVQNLTLVITGNTNKTCVFYPYGTSISGCGNLTIFPINTQSYGYSETVAMYGYGYGYDVSATSYGDTNESFGYGYGYGYVYGYTDGGLYGAELKYNITWNISAESSATTGNYTAYLEADAQDATGYKIYSNINNKTNFTLDKGTPGVTLSSPSNITYNANKAFVEFTATDDWDSSLTCSYALDGTSTSIGSATNNTATNTTTATMSNQMHALNVTCLDDAGNSGTSSTLYFTTNYTVQQEITITVGTSTPAINKTAETPAKVSVIKVNKTLPVVAPGLFKKIELENSTQSNIKSLSVKTKNTQTNVTISVQTLDSKPTETEEYAISGAEQVYSYLEFTSSISDDDLEEVKIEFQLPKSWLEENNLTTSQVRLARFHNNEWVTLSTSFVSEDSENYYFEATSPGFSYYAIIAKAVTSITTLRDLFDLIDSYFSGTSALTLRELFDAIELYFGG